MSVNDIEFDTFVRCYSVANEIVYSRTGKLLFWTGGCNVVEIRPRQFKIVPGQQGDQKEFRQRVIKDLQANIDIISRQAGK